MLEAKVRQDVFPHASEWPVYWLDLDGEPPSCLDDLGIRRLGAGLTGHDWHAVVLAPVSAERAGSQIRDLRREIGTDAYLVAVARADLPSGWLVRLMELGADDVVEHGSRDQLSLALTRARRTLTTREADETWLTELAAERDDLQACIDTLPSPIFYKNRQGRYLGCNRAFAASFGYAAEKIVGASVHEIFPPHLARIYEDSDDRLMAAGGTTVYDARVRFADGTDHDVVFYKAAIRDGAGTVRGLAGAMLDITERHAL